MGRTDIIRKQIEDVQDAIDDAFDAGQQSRGARLVGVRDLLRELVAESEKVYRVTVTATYTVDVNAPDPKAVERWFWGLPDPPARMDPNELHIDAISAVQPWDASRHVQAHVNSRGEEV